jgi:hypothetical protein
MITHALAQVCIHINVYTYIYTLITKFNNIIAGSSCATCSIDVHQGCDGCYECCYGDFNQGPGIYIIICIANRLTFTKT